MLSIYWLENTSSYLSVVLNGGWLWLMIRIFLNFYVFERLYTFLFKSIIDKESKVDS